MQITVMQGGYLQEETSHHIVLAGLSAEIQRRGYRLQRVASGTCEQPAIDAQLTNGPPDGTDLDIPIELSFEQYAGHGALNAKVILTGLRNRLSEACGMRGGLELNIRVFLPNFDGEYLGPEDATTGDDAEAVGGDQPRNRVMMAILARRGARAFRDAQLERFGRMCAISSCAVVDVLEAAHIRAYRTDADNARANGVLLRADLQTLYDLDLIAVNPETQRLAVHASVQDADYRQFHERQIRAPAGGFDRIALRQRWELFQARDM